MSKDRRAENLTEVAAQATLEPLRTGDDRYVDMSKGRESSDLEMMQVHLQDHRASDNRFAKIAFTGHRGCGKSTELYRLEDRLTPRFLSLHLFVDDNLLQDCEYTDLILWLTESLVRRFAEDPKLSPLDAALVDDITEWFAEKTLEDLQSVKSEIEASTEAETKAKTGFYWLSLGLLARIKSVFRSSVERRQSVRRTLQKYGADLLSKANLLLDNAHEILRETGRYTELLVVHDNLDRMPADASRRLYFDNGDLLKQLRAHVIYTVPIAMVLSPWDIGKVFESHFTMPMVKTHNQENDDFEEGIGALVELLSHRLVLAKVFIEADVAKAMAKYSGGSVRDLIRLLNYSQLAARVAGKETIDGESLERAANKLRLEYQRLLRPSRIYYPLLAKIHRDKSDHFIDEDDASPEKGREFFAELLFNASVMEYNGDESWYDVHPVITQIRDFQDVFKTIGVEG